MTKNPQKPLRPMPELRQELGQTIGEVSRAWRHHMNQRLKPFGLNVSMRQVLIQLHRHPDGLMQRELAEKLGIEGPTLVRLLDRLEKREWIKRIVAGDDKRRKYAVLSTKASEQLEIIEKQSQALRSEMMKGLSATELENGLGIMSRLRDNLLKKS